MDNYFELNIKADKPEDAKKIVNFLNAIYSNCTNKELIEAADTVDKDPKVIRKIIKVASNKAVKQLVSKFM